MSTYKITFSVNGTRSEQIVKANSSIDAKKLVQMQYTNQRITFYSVVRID